MGREVSFSFDSEEERKKVEVLARKRGLRLSAFVRWCVYKYLRDREANTAGNLARRAKTAPGHDSTE